MSDRLALAHAIEDAGISREQAENIATAIARFVEGSAATKADVQASEAAVRADLQAFRATVASEIARLDTKVDRLDAKVDLLDAKVDLVGSRTFNRLGALVTVVATLLFAALHVWPPH